MDPATATQMADPTTLAMLVAAVMGLIKVLEISIQALVKKYGKQDKTNDISITLDPDVTKKITAIADKIDQVHTVMQKTDNDGTPMVYSSRSGMEAVRDIAVIIRNVSMTQERLANVMDRLEQKFSEHDRTDSSVQQQIAGGLERLLRAFEDHDKRMASFMATQNDYLRTAQQNAETILRKVSERE